VLVVSANVILDVSRELALQIAEQFRALGSPINVKDIAVVGGGCKYLFIFSFVKSCYINSSISHL
jgi:hypothetical protein